MNDMTSVIVPKSDQINADDLIAGPMTITVREVQIRGGQEQPVSIFFEGSDKAFRPCKSMSRVLVQGWGPDASKYVGRSLTLYRDPTVRWAGMEVGGIRISHLSHIDGEKLMMLTATKGSRKPHKVLPLVVEQQRDKAAEWATSKIAAINAAADADALAQIEKKGAGALAKLEKQRPELHASVITATEAKRAEFMGGDFGDDDPFAADAETPAWAAYVDSLKKRIIEASDAAELDEIAGLVADSDGLPEAEVAALDAAIAGRRREVA